MRLERAVSAAWVMNKNGVDAFELPAQRRVKTRVVTWAFSADFTQAK